MDKAWELLSPDNFSDAAEKQLEKLKATFETVSEQLKKLPDGSLYSKKSHGVNQFFASDGTYISKKNLSLIKRLSQKKYLEGCVFSLQKQIASLEQLTAVFKKTDINEAFTALPEPLKPFVSPILLPDAEFSRIWLSEEYSGNQNHEIQGGFFTSSGIHVRSKSEVIIADVLQRSGVPFRYEYPVELKRSGSTGGGYTSGGGTSGGSFASGGTYTSYPDFYCLNLHTRAEFIWEHFGLMDDPDYADRMVQKLSDFQKNGWICGQNLIFTLETAQHQLDTRTIEQLIQRFLK